jgi:hypothetical protein
MYSLYIHLAYFVFPPTVSYTPPNIHTLDHKLYKDSDFSWFSTVLSPQGLDQCLTQSRYSLNTCLMNDLGMCQPLEAICKMILISRRHQRRREQACRVGMAGSSAEKRWSPERQKTLILPGMVIPSLGRLRQEDGKFKGSLGYIVRLYLKNKKPLILNFLFWFPLDLWHAVHFLSLSQPCMSVILPTLFS